MDPLIAGAVATFGVAIVTTSGHVIVSRMNVNKEKTKAAEDSASQAAEKVTQRWLAFKDEQVEYWKSRYETCMEERVDDRR